MLPNFSLRCLLTYSFGCITVVVIMIFGSPAAKFTKLKVSRLHCFVCQHFFLNILCAHVCTVFVVLKVFL